MEIVNKEYKSTTKGSMADKFRRKAVKMSGMQRKHERTIEEMMKYWMDGGHGYIPEGHSFPGWGTGGQLLYIGILVRIS